jgi:transcriptional regulator with XRE-family HTH domain
MKPSRFPERLAEAMREAGVNQVALAKAIGVTKSAVNQILKGGSKGMKQEHLLLACQFLRVHPEWLALGVGPMRQEPLSSDRDLLDQLRSLSPEKQETVASVIKGLSTG